MEAVNVGRTISLRAEISNNKGAALPRPKDLSILLLRLLLLPLLDLHHRQLLETIGSVSSARSRSMCKQRACSGRAPPAEATVMAQDVTGL